MTEQINFYNKNTVLFDLDGTVINSKEGIFNAIKYMCDRIDLKIEDESKLIRFIGPSIASTLITDFGFSPKDASASILIYREYYSTKGLLECEIYDGILELVKTLKKQGKKVGLATKKPEEYAKAIMTNLGLDLHFDAICGSSPDEINDSKAHIITNARTLLNSSKEETVMVGDSKYDIIGAVCADVESIGVLYGFGNEQEMIDESATTIVKDVFELTKILTQR